MSENMDATVVTEEATPETAEDPNLLAAGEAGKAAQEAASEEEETVSEQTEDAKGDDVKEGAPDSYEDFTVPEGMEVDADLMKEFVPIAKENNLTQEQAQKLVDVYNKQQEKSVEAAAQGWQDIQSEWRKSSENDSEFGGSNFQENIGKAKEFLKEFGTDELYEALEVTGVGNHPEFIRAFARAGKALSEARVVTGKTVAPQQKTIAETLFPNQN